MKTLKNEIIWDENSLDDLVLFDWADDCSVLCNFSDSGSLGGSGTVVLLLILTISGKFCDFGDSYGFDDFGGWCDIGACGAFGGFSFFCFQFNDLLLQVIRWF